jgi:hypothetical protein
VGCRERRGEVREQPQASVDDRRAALEERVVPEPELRPRRLLLADRPEQRVPLLERPGVGGEVAQVRRDRREPARQRRKGFPRMADAIPRMGKLTGVFVIRGIKIPFVVEVTSSKDDALGESVPIPAAPVFGNVFVWAMVLFISRHNTIVTGKVIRDFIILLFE